MQVHVGVNVQVKVKVKLVEIYKCITMYCVSARVNVSRRVIRCVNVSEKSTPI